MATASADAPRPSSLHGIAFRSGIHRARPDGAKATGLVLPAEFVAFAGRRRLLVAALLILAGALLEGFGILLIVPLLHAFLETGPTIETPALSWLSSPSPAAQSALLVAGFVALMLLRGVVLVARDTRMARLQWGFIEAAKLRLFDRLSAAPWREVMAFDRPRLNRALGSDMVQVGLAVNAMMQTAAALLMLAAYCAFAFALAPGLALPALGILAAVALAGTLFVRRAGAFGRAMLGYDLRMEESASRFLTGLKLAKAQDLQAGFLSSYAAASRAGVDTRVGFVRTMSASRQLAMAFGAVAAAAAVMVAVLATGTAPAALLTFVVLLSRTAAPVAQVQQGLQQLANALPIYSEVQDLVRSLPRTRQAVAEAAHRSPPGISFRNASLLHESSLGEARVGIRAVDLDIAPGEFVGLAGATGSGKSTLLDLAAGLETPHSGEVHLGGSPASEEHLAAHRASLAYLAADPFLFGGTVRSNLGWAAPNADDHAMWRALEVAGATRVIRRLGEGLESRIHEAGANLSAGERQQVALARALLRRPSLLLLDEATCSLDADCERTVLGNLARIEPRPTLLFVSHRSASFSLCDRVVTLSEGQIASVRRVA